MSWAFTSAELAGLRTAQSVHMMDSCKIGTYTDDGADAYNNPDPSWPLGSEMACGYKETKVDEGLDAAHVPLSDGQFRLPIGTVITSQDRLQLTKRHGTAITPIMFSVVGDPKRGSSGLVVDVKVVTDGS